MGSAPADGSQIVIRTDRSLTSVPPPSQQVARLEDVLTVAPKKPDSRPASTQAPADAVQPEPESSVVEQVEQVEPPSGPKPAHKPKYVSARTLRAAFWFEQSSVVLPNAVDRPADPQPVEAAVPAPVKPSVPPPVPQVDAAPAAVSFEVPAEASGNHWMAAISLLALILLVVMLTGRAPRRLTGAATH